MKRRLTADEYVSGVIAGDRTILARAITLVESRRPADRNVAEEVLTKLLPRTGKAVRLGITGVPGAGKSTLIEKLGLKLLAQNHALAVLAIDPSSTLSGGSILGDKTRMPELALDPRAFIRPSPSAASLGGVGRRTRETLLLVEAAGFDVVFVETVGVGQSEAMVADMVDTLLMLIVAGAGDELQGIKRGIVEMADIIAVNKADGDDVFRARLAQREYAAAVKYLRSRTPEHTAKVLTISAKTGDGIDTLWSEIVAHRRRLLETGAFDRLRKEQQLRWMWTAIEERLMIAFRSKKSVLKMLPAIEQAVADGTLPATRAADRLLAQFGIEPAED